jgi:plasmid stabilization system protein ParE
MAERKIIWSARAKNDLIEILDYYYKRNGTKTYSKKLNSTLRKSIKLLKKYPYIGVKTDIQSVRNLITSCYSIFYEIGSESIEIITIWDDRQNPDNLILEK